MALPAPILPELIEELIVQPEDTLRDAILKTFVRLPVVVYKIIVWMFNSDGTPTQEFRDWVCAGCEGEDETTETTE